MKIKINGTEKDVEFKSVYTRKIDREFNEKLFGNGSFNANDVKIAPMNIQIANDYLIVAMTNLSSEELDEVSTKDYDELLKKINEIKATPQE